MMRKSIVALFAAGVVAAGFWAAPCGGQAVPKRPMTFDDMMHMKRLGETAVSPDGKWLAYSVTTMDLEQNTKTAQLWVQAIAPSNGSGGDPMPLAVGKPGDSGIEFAPDGKTIVFASDKGAKTPYEFNIFTAAWK